MCYSCQARYHYAKVGIHVELDIAFTQLHNFYESASHTLTQRHATDNEDQGRQCWCGLDGV